MLSGAHNYLFARVLELLKEKGADDIAVFGGGIIPPEDIRPSRPSGVKELFTPGTSTQDIVRFVRENIRAAVCVRVDFELTRGAAGGPGPRPRLRRAPRSRR